MTRTLCLILAALVSTSLLAGLGGCVSVGGDRPLVELNGFSRSERSAPANDPAPGVPDEELTAHQRTQRQLADCQRDLASLERRYRELENQRNEQRRASERRIKDLEKRIDDLEDELEDCRDD